MTNAVSRIVIAAALAPVVLGAVYFGRWWLFGLAAFAARESADPAGPLGGGSQAVGAPGADRRGSPALPGASPSRRARSMFQ